MRLRVSITGIVQGVGFRPHVHKLAERFGVRGWVLNNSSGVTMEIEPPAGRGRETLDSFLEALGSEAPPLARILTMEATELPPIGFEGFSIRDSERLAGELTLISPDVAACADCRREMLDRADRRHLYPFINCTNCGPRYTIIESIPYDRPNTTMAEFAMCPACLAEYRDVADRRYHAQPDCCHVCGPRVKLHSASGEEVPEENAIVGAARLLKAGQIVAIKGIGGFHLACDASNDAAVKLLRDRKKRAKEKPFAVMVADLSAARAICAVSDVEAKLLSSNAAPILLLKKLPASPYPVSAEVAPGQERLGVMLAYAPLHIALFQEMQGAVLVMTSGNQSEEPLVSDNADALSKLSGLANAFLVHDRRIHARCDDSVARVVAGRVQLIRHSRGYSPYPVSFKDDGPMVLAVGAEKKNTFALTRGRFGFLSPHLGDMENFETMRFFEDTLAHYKSLFTIKPESVACDLHPDYLTTKWAEAYASHERLPLVRVQHHHAHMAAVLAEHGESGPALGISFDGTGYGTDGTLWGGEFLVGDLAGFGRYAQFLPLSLPGGEGAIREPWRVALALLRELEDRDLADAAIGRHVQSLVSSGIAPDAISDVRLMLARNLNCVPTSSCGRLFDGVSSLLGICHVASFEGQAAMLLEEAAGDAETWQDALSPYPWRWIGAAPLVFDWRGIVSGICRGLLSGENVRHIAARFHLTLVDGICDAFNRARDDTGVELVTLSGGCFQNAYLVEESLSRLTAMGAKVLFGALVPPNDAGIALGQAAIARKTGLL